MPNVTVYIPQAQADWLKSKDLNQSALMQAAIARAMEFEAEQAAKRAQVEASAQA